MAKVWVTRDEQPDGPLSNALAEAGLQPILEPVIRRRVVRDISPELTSLNENDWLVLTSPFAIENVPLELARVPRLAVVGERSRQIAEARGLSVHHVSRGPGAQALFHELTSSARGLIVCYPRSSEAHAPQLPDDIGLVSPVLYETRPRAFRREIMMEVDTAAFASPSAVRAVGAVPGLRYASIGPTTSEAIRVLGLEPWVEADRPTFAALAEAIRASSD